MSQAFIGWVVELNLEFLTDICGMSVIRFTWKVNFGGFARLLSIFSTSTLALLLKSARLF